MTWTHIGEHKLMYLFIILCLYSQVCSEFFLSVFGLVLVLECVHSHDRRPPVRHPPHHHLLGYHGAAFLQCARASRTPRVSVPLTLMCNLDGAARSSWRPLTFDSSLIICFCSTCTSDAACWLRRPPVRRHALRESTTSRSALEIMSQHFHIW